MDNKTKAWVLQVSGEKPIVLFEHPMVSKSAISYEQFLKYNDFHYIKFAEWIKIIKLYRCQIFDNLLPESSWGFLIETCSLYYEKLELGTVNSL